MANALALFDQGKPPAAVGKFLETESNIPDRVTVPSIGIKGKVWTLTRNGEQIPLMKKDADGEEVPVSVLPVIVLGFAKRRGRAYYESGYNPDSTKGPACWSEDGVAPHTSVKEPQHDKCASCPMNVKGSKVTDNGKAAKQCGEHRLVAVATIGKDGPEAYRLKLPVTSDWAADDKENEAKGWFAFSNFVDLLKARGVGHTAAIVTKLKFDMSVEYPKVMFSPARWLKDEELAIIEPLVKADETQALISGSWTPAGVDGVKSEPAAAPKDEPEVAKAKATPKQVAKPAPVEDEDDADVQIIPPKKPAAAKAKPAPVEDEDDDVTIVVPAKAPAKAKPAKTQDVVAKPVKASTDVDGDLEDLLKDWDE